MTTIESPETSESNIEQFRTELTGYCYRMMGSIFEAEDAVQETMIRAWKNFDSFEGRSSLRTWMYTIANNVCLTALGKNERKRVRPVDFGPSSFAELPIGPKREEVPWLEPAPDARVIPTNADPAEATVLKDSVRLAFVAAMQHLPPKQRAALILCEVLKWKSEEAADLLDTSEAAINSALQRARTTLDSLKDGATAPLSVELDTLAIRYAKSFEAYDMDAIVSMLHEDVIMSMPPYDLWMVGPSEVQTWLTGHGNGCRGSRLLMTTANGSTAFGQYRLDEDGTFQAWALQVIDFNGDRISAITSFLDTPALFPLFDLPEELDSSAAR